MTLDLPTAVAIATVVTAIGGILVGFYKLKPESARIFVDSAKVSVELAASGRDKCEAEKATLKAEFDEYRRKAEARERVSERNLSAAHEEVAKLRRMLSHPRRGGGHNDGGRT